jgi:hypothetical protein
MLTVNILNDSGGFAAVPLFLRHGLGYVQGISDVIMSGWVLCVCVWLDAVNIRGSFLFCAGMSYRLVFTKTKARGGLREARTRVLLPRAVGLWIVSLSVLVRDCFAGLTSFITSFLYGVSFPIFRTWETPAGAYDYFESFFTGSFFGVLTQMANAMLWCVFVVDKSIKVRIIFAVIR